MRRWTGKAREWLSKLVTEDMVAFARQKQALNGIAFVLYEVRGIEDADLRVEFR